MNKTEEKKEKNMLNSESSFFTENHEYIDDNKTKESPEWLIEDLFKRLIDQEIQLKLQENRIKSLEGTIDKYKGMIHYALGVIISGAVFPAILHLILNYKGH